MILPENLEADIAAYESRHSKSKAGRDSGAYYTPNALAEYLVSRSLRARLNEQLAFIRKAIKAKNFDAANGSLSAVQKWRIIDPACGTGIFLVNAGRALQEFYAACRSRDWPSSPLAEKNLPMILTAQLHGFDIDETALALTHQRLDALMAPGTLPKSWPNIRHADALLQENFPPYEFVLGNPPYLSEVRRQAETFRKLKDSPYYRAKMDLCDAFMQWAIDYLAPDGSLAYVLPEYWMQRSSTTPVREALWERGRFDELWAFGDSPMFTHAPGHHSSLLLWRKSSNRDTPPTGHRRSVQLGFDTPPHADRLQPGHLLQSDGKLLFGTAVETDLLAYLKTLRKFSRASSCRWGGSKRRMPNAPGRRRAFC